MYLILKRVFFVLFCLKFSEKANSQLSQTLGSPRVSASVTVPATKEKSSAASSQVSKASTSRNDPSSSNQQQWKAKYTSSESSVQKKKP